MLNYFIMQRLWEASLARKMFKTCRLLNENWPFAQLISLVEGWISPLILHLTEREWRMVRVTHIDFVLQTTNSPRSSNSCSLYSCDGYVYCVISPSTCSSLVRTYLVVVYE
jgi:hypothetical protein